MDTHEVTIQAQGEDDPTMERAQVTGTIPPPDRSASRGEMEDQLRLYGTCSFKSTPPEGLYPGLPQPIRQHLRPGKTPCDRVSEHPETREDGSPFAVPFGSAEVASHRTDEAGAAETHGLGFSAEGGAIVNFGPDLVDASVQTELSLPLRVETIWQCHCIGAETIVDAPETSGGRKNGEADIFENDDFGNSNVEDSVESDSSSGAALKEVKAAQKEIVASAESASEATESVNIDPRQANEPNHASATDSGCPKIEDIDSLESVGDVTADEKLASMMMCRL